MDERVREVLVKLKLQKVLAEVLKAPKATNHRFECERSCECARLKADFKCDCMLIIVSNEQYHL